MPNISDRQRHINDLVHLWKDVMYMQVFLDEDMSNEYESIEEELCEVLANRLIPESPNPSCTCPQPH